MEVSVSIVINVPTRGQCLDEIACRQIRKRQSYDRETQLREMLRVLSKNDWIVFYGREKNEFIQVMKDTDGWLVDFPVVEKLRKRRHQFWEVRTVLDKMGFWHTRRYWWELLSKRYPYTWREDGNGVGLTACCGTNYKLAAGVIEQVYATVFQVPSGGNFGYRFGSWKKWWW